MKPINVLSLFDGISCGMVALERAGIPINKYFASEIKQCAIKCSKANYPEIIQLGDVTKIHYKDGKLYSENGKGKVKIDLLIGGSPCQDFSTLNSFNKNKEYGLKGNKSKLFYEYLRLKEEINPKYFLLENVKMKKDSERELNNFLGVEGLHIDSRLVSYQIRARIYWTNIPNIKIPKDKKISFQDYKDANKNRLEEAKVNKTPSRIRMWNNGNGVESIGNCANITHSDKIGCLTRKQDRCPNSGLVQYNDFCRFLTRREIELAQTLPPNYCNMLSFNETQDVCGDGWTVDVIAHIFKYLKKELEWKEAIKECEE